MHSNAGLLYPITRGRGVVCDRLGILLGVACVTWGDRLGCSKLTTASQLSSGRGVASGAYIEGPGSIGPLLLAPRVMAGVAGRLWRGRRLVVVALGLFRVRRWLAVLLCRRRMLAVTFVGS